MYYIEYEERKNGRVYFKVSYPMDRIEYCERFYKRFLERSNYHFFLRIVEF